jgi:predicted transcriptional regulator
MTNYNYQQLREIRKEDQKLRELAGPVVQFSINRPMGYETFKSISQESRDLYLQQITNFCTLDDFKQMLYLPKNYKVEVEFQSLCGNFYNKFLDKTKQTLHHKEQLDKFISMGYVDDLAKLKPFNSLRDFRKLSKAEQKNILDILYREFEPNQTNLAKFFGVTDTSISKMLKENGDTRFTKPRSKNKGLRPGTQKIWNKLFEKDVKPQEKLEKEIQPVDSNPNTIKSEEDNTNTSAKSLPKLEGAARAARSIQLTFDIDDNNPIDNISLAIAKELQGYSGTILVSVEGSTYTYNL